MTVAPTRLLIFGALLGVLACSASPAFAEAPSPWFHLASVARPGHLQPEGSENEVQRLTVSATKGDVFVADLPRVEASEGTEGFAVFPYNAPASVVQKELETKVYTSQLLVAEIGLNVYPSRKVLVTGGPGDGEGTKPYEITFPGQPVEPIFASGELAPGFGPPGTEALSCEGCVHEATATVTEVAKGRLDGEIAVTAINVGDATADAEAAPVKILDRLPAGLSAVFAQGNTADNVSRERGPVECALKTSHEVECTFGGTFERENDSKEREVLPKVLPPYEQIEVVIGVTVEPAATSGGLNETSVSGGGAPAALLKHPITVSKAPAEPTPFGVEAYEQTFEEVGGAPDAQAGSHPFQFTTTLDLNQTSDAGPAALAKDLSFDMPPGFIGNPTAYPRCTLAQFSGEGCPDDTVLGIADVTAVLNRKLEAFTALIFNLEPAVGEPARFAFDAPVPVFIDTSVRTGQDYGVTAHVDNILQDVGFTSTTVTLWGVPGDPRHDNVRGDACLAETDGEESAEERRLEDRPPCHHLEESHPPPFLALPTSCTGPLQDSVDARSWAEPSHVLSFQSEPRQAPLEGSMPALDGCGSLPFSSEIAVSPDVDAASTPSGLKVDVHVPQEEALNASGLAPSDVRNITVALPAGVAVNPGSADGLEVCSQAQIGFTGLNPQSGTDEIHPHGTVVSRRVEDRQRDDHHAFVAEPAKRLRLSRLAAELCGSSGKPVLLAPRVVYRCPGPCFGCARQAPGQGIAE